MDSTTAPRFKYMGGPAVVLLTLEVCVESNIRHAGQYLGQ